MSERSYLHACVRCQRDLIYYHVLDVREILFTSLFYMSERSYLQSCVRCQRDIIYKLIKCYMLERSYLQAYARCHRDLTHKLMLDVREILFTSLF